jgi:hypothetical protein
MKEKKLCKSCQNKKKCPDYEYSKNSKLLDCSGYKKEGG